jgi:uncharacterized cupredoxin-like copper-binding protein
MFIKTIFISTLLTGVFAVTAFAGGSHAYDDEQQMQEEPHEHMTSGSGPAEHNMEGMDHDMAHQHDVEGSVVGQPVPEAQATKTIHVITLDTMRYKFSSQPDLKAGDIVKFVITNQGKIAHEFSIGDEEEQETHGEMMRKMPDMVHEDGNTVTVKPGKTKVLIWKFKSANDVVFACNIPGHFEAGMFRKVTVSP